MGDRYTFEKQVTKLRAGDKGFADVWLRDHFAWEYKGKHKDLHRAYVQLADYREDLGNPPLLVVCDLNRFEVHTNFTSTSKRVYSFDLDDLGRNTVTATCPIPPLEVLRALFDDTSLLRPERTAARVTEDAAKKFLRLAERLEIEPREQKPSKAEIAHFLMRIVFCLFADSIGLLPEHVFRDMVRAHRTRPKKFRKKLADLFEAMSNRDAEERYFGAHDIKYFNGGLFDGNSTIELNEGDMGILYDAAANLDWSHIEPAIFGSLFERSLDADKRSLIGAHYTSSADILLLIEPVVMAPLRRRWTQVREEITATLDAEHSGPAAELAPTRLSEGPGFSPAMPATAKNAALAAEVALTPPTRAGFSRGGAKAFASTFPLLRSRATAEDLMSAWLDQLTSVTVLDPACGSGNFLYIALQKLLDLWKESRDFALAQGLAVVRPGHVSPRQLFGIETDFYAHELASMVVWIGYLQWMHQHGEPITNEPILEQLTNIEKGDSILRYDAAGKPYEPTWPKATYIVGNPPFLGDKKMRRELDTTEHPTYVEDLRTLYAGRVPGGADLVAYWFEKSRAQIEASTSSRAGLIATNSISMVRNRPVLDRIVGSGNIFMAWSDNPWVLSGAAVRVALVGFDNGSEESITLEGRHVIKINADLSSGQDVSGALHLTENDGICFLGMMKAGPFDIDHLVAEKMLREPPNPNGRTNSDVVKRRLGSRDITDRDRNGWIIDFGVDMSGHEAALYQLPFEYIRHTVKPIRDSNNRKRLRERWWIHGEARPGLRRARARLNRCIATPEVSKHRLFAWLEQSFVPDHKLHVFVRDDDYFFGVLHSRPHEQWTLATCSWIGKGNDPSYNSATTFETFPPAMATWTRTASRPARPSHRRSRKTPRRPPRTLAQPAKHPRSRPEKAHPHPSLQRKTAVAAGRPPDPRPRRLRRLRLAHGPHRPANPRTPPHPQSPTRRRARVTACPMSRTWDMGFHHARLATACRSPTR